MIVRYADDIVVGFAHEVDARRFWDAMRKRFEEFALSLHPEKTSPDRVRSPSGRTGATGAGSVKPETFNFLGFTHICGRSRHGKFLLKRKSRRDRMRGKLNEIKEEMRRRMHQSIPSRGVGWRRLSEATSPITPCRPTRRRSELSATMWLTLALLAVATQSARWDHLAADQADR